MIEASYVREILDYDPSTGGFTWRFRPDMHARWNTCNAGKKAGGLGGCKYVAISINGVRYLAHRLAWLHFYGEWPAKQIDHINRNRVDNRISNLRLAESWQNAVNVVVNKANTSGVKGVYWVAKNRRWRAAIRANKQRISLGCYGTLEEAAEAYRNGALKYHGEFARF